MRVAKTSDFNASFITCKVVCSPVSQLTQLLNNFGLGLFETHLARPIRLELTCCAAALWLGVVQSDSLFGLSRLPLCAKYTLFSASANKYKNSFN